MSAQLTAAKRVPLKRLFKIVNGATPSSGVESYWNGDVPWVTPEDLGSLKSRTIVETRRLLTEDGFANCGASMVPARSLILSTRAPIGHLAITAVDCCTNQGCKALVARDGQLDSYFYYQLIAIREILQARGRGSTFKELSTEDLSQVELWCPPSPTRSRIAAYLDRETAQIDALVAEKETLLGLLEEKRASLISHAVTRGLNPRAKLKPSGIPWLGDVPVHWKVKRIKHLANIIRGKFTYRPRNAPHLYNGPFPFIQTGDVARADKYITSHTQTLSEAGYEVSKEFPKGTLCMTIAANVGDVAILEFDACFPDSVVGFRPSTSNSVDYLYYLFLSLRPQLLETSVVSTQANLNIDRVGTLKVAVPPLDEQRITAAFLAKLDKGTSQLRSEIQTSITLLREKRSSLISAAVTGEMAVP